MKEFIEKLISRLEEYKYSHLVEHDSEQCKHCAEKTYNECEHMDCSFCIWNKATEIVHQLSEEWDGGWIPCNERLPEENQRVLGCLAHGGVIGVIFCNGLFSGIYEYDTNEIVAWQPIPQPYKPKEK